LPTTQKRQGKPFRSFHIAKGMPSWPYVTGSHVTVPQHPQTAPGSGHGVPILRRPGADQHPLLPDKREGIEAPGKFRKVLG